MDHRTIETEEQFEDFLQHYEKQDRVFIDAVPVDQTVHPRRSGVSFVFVHTEEGEEAVFPVRHNDAKGLPPKSLLKLNTTVEKYAFDKKKVMHLVPFRGLVDCKLVHFFKHNQPPSFSTPDIRPEAKNLYRPLPRLIERCQKRVQKCKGILDDNGVVLPKTPFRKYNGEILETLFRVERSGMYSDPEDYVEAFEEDHTDKNNLAYSRYNLYTQTGRPSNTFKGVNYAALDHDQRLAFRSRFDGGKLVNVDYDAFHLRIISSLIDYDAPQESFHEHLGKLYFGEEDFDEEDYKDAKGFTFQFIYNPYGIPDELLQLDFFSGVKRLTKQIWEVYEDYGVISTPKHGRQITGSKIDDFNPAKALNYVLQAGGVEIICEHMKQLLDYLSDKNTEVVLYLYDSVLLDYDPDDGAEISEIKSIMETGDLKVDIEIGSRFGELEEIHINE